MLDGLAHYPAVVARVEWVPLGHAGGFSGSSLWRGQLHGERLFVLKAWQHDYPAERLETIHRWMTYARRNGDLSFVPEVVPSESGRSVVEAAGRVWDVTAWLPGIADFSAEPNDAKLMASCQAIAKLHRAWVPRQVPLAPCPGVERRILLLRGFDPNVTILKIDDPKLRDLLTSALPTLRRLVPLALAVLEPWRVKLGPLQPCLCDVWHDHVLFTGNQVSGVIDYGSMKLDHPAVDLARWLGDTVGDYRERIELGLTAYRDAGGPWNPDAEFVSCLDATGVICAVIHWIHRLSARNQPHESEQVLQRVQKLTTRLATIRLQTPTSAARIESLTILSPRPARGEP